jgi:hypothetical protein
MTPHDSRRTIENMTAQGIEAFASPEAEPIHAGHAARPSASGHWVEVLFDRMDQLEFTLSDETGVQGELLQAVGEIGAQLDTVLARLDTSAPTLLPPTDADPGAMTGDADLAAADELLSTALSPLHDSVGHLSLLLQGIAARQNAIAEAMSHRIDQIESHLATIPAQGSSPDLTGLADQVAGLETRLGARIKDMLDHAPPRLDLAPLDLAVARLATTMQAHAGEQSRALAQTADRLDRIEARVSALSDPQATADLIDGLESRLQQRLDLGLNALLAALPAVGAPNPDRDRDALRRATAALEAVTSLASESTATARLTELVERIAAQLAAQEPAPLQTPGIDDPDTRDAACATRVDDMPQSSAPSQTQHEDQLPASNLMTADDPDGPTFDPAVDVLDNNQHVPVAETLPDLDDTRPLESLPPF